MKNNKNTETHTTVSKGYRLKPSTHKLIKQVQQTLNFTQEKIIRKAIKLFARETGISGKAKVTK